MRSAAWAFALLSVTPMVPFQRAAWLSPPSILKVTSDGGMIFAAGSVACAQLGRPPGPLALLLLALQPAAAQSHDLRADDLSHAHTQPIVDAAAGEQANRPTSVLGVDEGGASQALQREEGEEVWRGAHSTPRRPQPGELDQTRADHTARRSPHRPARSRVPQAPLDELEVEAEVLPDAGAAHAPRGEVASAPSLAPQASSRRGLSGTVTSAVSVSDDDYPDEVSWTLTCDDGTSESGGASYSADITVANGASCELLMEDSYGDGWWGAEWTGFGQTFTLYGGYSDSESFTVEAPSPLPPTSPSPPASPPAPPLSPPAPPSPPQSPSITSAVIVSGDGFPSEMPSWRLRLRGDGRPMREARSQRDDENATRSHAQIDARPIQVLAPLRAWRIGRAASNGWFEHCANMPRAVVSARET